MVREFCLTMYIERPTAGNKKVIYIITLRPRDHSFCFTERGCLILLYIASKKFFLFENRNLETFCKLHQSIFYHLSGILEIIASNFN